MKPKQKNSGQSLTEFVILFPIICYFTLIIIQSALIYNAYQIVNYAAYCSARSAVVYQANREKMKKAACIAIAPIVCGKSTRGKLPSKYSIHIPKIPGIFNHDDIVLYLRKYRCAYLKTEVIEETRIAEEITVTVTHHYQLIVPAVGAVLVPLLRIWDMPFHVEAQESSKKFGTPHLPVRATCTLPI